MIHTGALRVGVDLGTAYVVVTALDEAGDPVGIALEPAAVVKDGLVVDYLGAIDIVRALVRNLEEALGSRLLSCAVGLPPGTRRLDGGATVHVCEAAGLEVERVVDEPSAAAALLGIGDGVVVDVGGGTTGISVLQAGRVVYTADDPTGGTHFTLVIAGRFGIDFQEAERIKLTPEEQPRLFPILVPVMEKVARIVARHISGHPAERVYLVGGAAAMQGFADVMAQRLGMPVVVPPEPLLVTPLGIALHARAGGVNGGA